MDNDMERALNAREKVSVIVPVYNVERYIGRCVESLMQQDFENIQIILVDDGSPDKSFEIISELAKQDKRIIVIQQKNSGVSAARNRGIEASDGDYLMFVDGDDYVDKNYVSYFVNLLHSKNCDIGFDLNNYQIDGCLSRDDCFEVSAEKAIEWIYSGEIFVAVWNKIYSAKLLKNSNIKFNEEIWYGEGMLFNVECLQSVEKVAIGGKAVYHQTFNPDSAMRKFNLESQFCGIRSLDLQKAIWKKKNIDIERAWEFHKYCFNRSIIDGLVRAGMVRDNLTVYRDCVRALRKDIVLPLRNEKSLRKKLGWCCYFISPGLMARRHARKFAFTAKKYGAKANRI